MKILKHVKDELIVPDKEKLPKSDISFSYLLRSKKTKDIPTSENFLKYSKSCISIFHLQNYTMPAYAKFMKDTRKAQESWKCHHPSTVGDRTFKNTLIDFGVNVS